MQDVISFGMSTENPLHQASTSNPPNPPAAALDIDTNSRGGNTQQHQRFTAKQLRAHRQARIQFQQERKALLASYLSNPPILACSSPVQRFLKHLATQSSNVTSLEMAMTSAKERRLMGRISGGGTSSPLLSSSVIGSYRIIVSSVVVPRNLSFTPFERSLVRSFHRQQQSHSSSSKNVDGKLRNVAPSISHPSTTTSTALVRWTTPVLRESLAPPLRWRSADPEVFACAQWIMLYSTFTEDLKQVGRQLQDVSVVLSSKECISAVQSLLVSPTSPHTPTSAQQQSQHGHHRKSSHSSSSHHHHQRTEGGTGDTEFVKSVSLMGRHQDHSESSRRVSTGSSSSGWTSASNGDISAAVAATSSTGVDDAQTASASNSASPPNNTTTPTAAAPSASQSGQSAVASNSTSTQQPTMPLPPASPTDTTTTTSKTYPTPNNRSNINTIAHVEERLEHTRSILSDQLVQLESNRVYALGRALVHANKLSPESISTLPTFLPRGMLSMITESRSAVINCPTCNHHYNQARGGGSGKFRASTAAASTSTCEEHGEDATLSVLLPYHTPLAEFIQKVASQHIEHRTKISAESESSSPSQQPQ
eukprot:TRINITY_DN8275_c0_g1_i4.p1 TRINITY_DN8275_c0_g1~~TRINITY_DN8275_c0_g1_i4.p1  ORF type:complete len:593 (-),score=73.14 TRINITY_DN8275_c0_g1_i4:42-1820(-)